jgi:5'-AMP-activated protein kinase catalytic alpha subunit
LEEYGFSKEESRQNILANKHDHITTTYYLILKRMIKEGKTSVADLVSKEFHEYINNNSNMLETWTKKLDEGTPNSKKNKEEIEKTQISPLKDKLEDAPLPATLLIRESNRSNEEIK